MKEREKERGKKQTHEVPGENNHYKVLKIWKF
jgi:hypothetical protein